MLSSLDLSSFNNADVLSSHLCFGWDVVISLGVVDDLSFNGNVLNSFIYFLDWLINHDGLFDFSSDVFDLGLNGIVVSDGSFDGNTFVSNDLFVFGHFNFKRNLVDLFDLLVFNVFLFEGNVFNSALDGDFLSDNLVGSACNSISSNGSTSGGGGVVLLSSSGGSSSVVGSGVSSSNLS